MAFTLAVAGTSQRLAITAVEVVNRQLGPSILRVVMSGSLDDATSRSPEEVYRVLREMEEAVKPLNGGQLIERDGQRRYVGGEPRLIVELGGVGTAVYEFLVKDKFRHHGDLDRRATWPLGVTHLPGGDPRRYRPFNKMMANLSVLIREDRAKITGNPELDRLRAEMAGFAPKETRGGALTLSDEADAYNEQVVSLAYAVLREGRYALGPRAYEDQFGKVWPSYLLAEAKRGSAVSNRYGA